MTLSPRPPTARRTARRRIGPGLLAVAIAATLAVPSAPAGADEEDDLRRDRGEVSRDIGEAAGHLEDSSKQLAAATLALGAVRDQLVEARATLSRTRGALAVARAYDDAMQRRLDAAEAELREALAELRRGEGRVDAAQETVRSFIISTASPADARVEAVSELVGGGDELGVTERLVATQSIGDAQTASLARLDASEVILQVKRDRVKDARDAVAERRADAAANLERKKDLEADAEDQAVAVAGLVSDAADARAAAVLARAADARQLQALEDDRDRITLKLKEIAAQERREAAAEARRAEREAAREAAAEEREDTSSSSGSAGEVTPDPVPDVEREVTSSPVIVPVQDTYVTSPFGMRVHPITGEYKLHDGTDFHADCGTPVYAPADGTILEQYYNEGYGNRIIMSNGYVDGVSLSTSVNHLTSFALSTGSTVTQGQLIGYSGTTGYSTACHMHFMVMENGVPVDPMSWL